MAETWQGTPVQEGRWSHNTGNWSEGPGARPRIDTRPSATYSAGWRFGDVQIPSGVIVSSATLTLRSSTSLSSEIYADLGAVASDNAPTFTTGGWSQPKIGSENVVIPAGPSGTDHVFDVTAAVQAVVNRSGWQQGNTLGLIANPLPSPGSFTEFHYDGVLAVEYAPPVQHLYPVTVQVPVTVGRITPSYAITVATTIDVPVSVGAVDIVAPRTLNARTVYVPLSVNQAQMSGTGQGPTVTMAHTLDLTATTGIALISVTIPPEPEPEPWERLIQTEEYHEALVAGTVDTDLFVEVIDDSETVLARLGGPDADYPGLRIGSVTCDGEAAIRWTTEVTVDDPDLVPVDPFDLLSPFSYNRLRLWWRIWLPRSQQWGQIPVGTLYPDLPELSDSEEGGLNVTIMASDAVALIKQAVWDVALDLSNMRVHEAIAAILEDRAPWAKWALTPTHYWVPKNFTPGEPNSDPWDDIEALADAAGQRAFVDRMGVIRTEPITRPGQPVGTFSEGPGSPMVDLPSVRTDMSRIANKITVTTADPEVDPPPYGYWQDDDPSSPLWVGRGRLFSKIIRNPIVTTNEQAQNYAINEGARRAVTRTVEATILPHPHLNPYDIIELNRERAALSGTHTLVSWTLDFSSRLMSITATNRKEFQEWMTT